MPASGCEGINQTSSFINGWISLITEFFVDPVSNNLPNREYVSIGDGLNARVEVDEELDLIRESSSDRYEMLKSIYYQNRNSQIEEDFVQNLPTPKIYIE